MTEVFESIHHTDGFGGSPEIDTALSELADISRMRSQAHEAANLFRDVHIEIGGLTERRLRRELSQAEGVLARWAVMASHEAFRTVDLARVENAGDWDATAEAERAIGEVALELFMGGRIDGLIERDTPESKLRITIDHGLLSARGLIAIRRKRLMLATQPLWHRFSDMRHVGFDYATPTPRGGVIGADVSFEIDKVSEFVLDFRELEATDREAAAEIRDAVEGGGRHEITGQARTSPDLIEAAIEQRDPMLTPAITTYYADRKYRNVHCLPWRT